MTSMAPFRGSVQRGSLDRRMRALRPCVVRICFAALRASAQGAPAANEAPPASDAPSDQELVAPSSDTPQSVLGREALVSRIEANLEFSRLVTDQKYKDALP